jgi:hypothetical protein
MLLHAGFCNPTSSLAFSYGLQNRFLQIIVNNNQATYKPMINPRWCSLNRLATSITEFGQAVVSHERPNFPFTKKV